MRKGSGRGGGGAKRDAVLDAALSLFSHYGYQRTSMEDVARKAGISKGAIYLYFESKEEIFLALSAQLLERTIEAARRAAGSEAPIAERILGVLEAKLGHLFDIIRNSAHAADLIDAKSRICADIWSKGEERYARLLSELLVAAAERGELRLDQAGWQPRELAELLVDAARGLQGEGASRPTGAAYRRRLGGLVALVTTALGATAAAGKRSRPPGARRRRTGATDGARP